MPTSAQRNQILQRLDAALTALEAGDPSLLAELIHQTFTYTFGGSTYIITPQWLGSPSDLTDIGITLMIRKMP